MWIGGKMSLFMFVSLYYVDEFFFYIRVLLYMYEIPNVVVFREKALIRSLIAMIGSSLNVSKTRSEIV